MKSAPGLRGLYPRPERRGFTPLSVTVAISSDEKLIDTQPDKLATGSAKAEKAAVLKVLVSTGASKGRRESDKKQILSLRFLSDEQREGSE